MGLCGLIQVDIFGMSPGRSDYDVRQMADGYAIQCQQTPAAFLPGRAPVAAHDIVQSAIRREDQIDEECRSEESCTFHHIAMNRIVRKFSRITPGIHTVRAGIIQCQGVIGHDRIIPGNAR